MSEGLLSKIRDDDAYALAYRDGHDDGFSAGHSEGWELGYNDASTQSKTGEPT